MSDYQWIPNRGSRPETGGKNILVRLACRDRRDVERKGNWQPPSYWKRWTIDNEPGDIAEYRLT